MRFTINDVRQVGEILSRVARTEIMPRFGKLVAGAVREKSSRFDVVTDADDAAERAMSTALAAAYPGAVVVGEEATASDHTLLAAIGDADFTFVLDPLDGTKNFASGLPLFGVMAAATVRGEVAIAVIHDPVCRTTAFALRGEGAWTEDEDGSRADLKVASAVPIGEMDAIAGTNFLPEPLRTTVNRNLSRLRMTSWLRCAAHEYRMAAAGHCDLLFYNKLMPWDHAAGWLLHREAGGYSAHFDGSAYRPTHLTGGLLCAPDEESWLLAKSALLEGAP
jgi:fructose-1,6-bisphosphatase/inositol monophosphatase family enzyme